VLIALLVVVLIIAGVYIGFDRYFSGMKNYNEAADPSDTSVVEFVVERGSSTTKIAEGLQEAGLIKSAKVFEYKTRLNTLDGTYQAGTFELSPSMKMEEIMSALQKAKAREAVRFTIPEGYTLKQTGEKLAAEGIVESAEAFYTALDKSYDYWFLDGKGSGYPDPTGTLTAHQNRLEGFLFPDTYEVYKDATPQQIIDKMLGRFDDILDLDMQKRMTEMDLDVNELVTIASMIERETMADSERPTVASVIYNRLDSGMKLQLDCTIQYALGEVKERVLYSDLEIDSPYNTYKVDGLPAGPIGAPGKSSLEAVIDPDTTDYIYYVLKPDGSGQHNFAATYKEFEKFKAEYINSL
jgi:UPF0755 protein